MLVTFKTDAHADIIMFGDVALTLAAVHALPFTDFDSDRFGCGFRRNSERHQSGNRDS